MWGDSRFWSLKKVDVVDNGDIFQWLRDADGFKK